ncbi:MAG TPA: PDZ domain-containing protein [Candidatus Acidoferrales bacterium]|nr:PDZ domain-containing protein [Candidatus Acidoferrales bacterium]
MRVSTYMKYMGGAAAMLGLAAGAAQPQERPATSKQSAAPAKESCSNSAFDSAALEKELAQMQSQLKTELANVQARAWQAKAEVAREMMEQGMRRAELAKLATQMQTERAGLEAQARTASQQAQQLFAQAPGVLDSEDTGWLGLEMTEVTPEKAKELKVSLERGVVVTEVLQGSPAAKAGLETNDVIEEYDGHTVEGTMQFRRLVRETPPGRSVNVRVMRGGTEKRLTIEVGSAARNMDTELRQLMPLKNFNFKFNMPEIFAGMTPGLGIEAEDVSGQLGEYFHVPGDAGVLVREVSPGTPAAKAGLKAGDVITRVDGVAVKTVDELREQLREKHEQKTVPLTVVRNGSQTTLTVALEQPATEPARVQSAAL